MFVLEVTRGARIGQALSLRLGTEVLVGRGRDAQLRLEDEAVSLRHAQIGWGEDGFSVTDLESRNGTYLNGRRVHGRAGLRVGDLLQVGEHLLCIKELEADLPLEDPRLREGTTQLLALSTTATKLLPRLALPSGRPEAGLLALRTSATVVSPGPARFLADGGVIELTAELARRLDGDPGLRVLVFVAGRFDRFERLPIGVGREQCNDLVLDDPLLSLRHAVIDARHSGFELRDLGSSNGTFVNGRRVVAQPIENGDVIGLGRHTLVVAIVGSRLGLLVTEPSVVDGSGPERADDRLGVVEPPRKGKSDKARRVRDFLWLGTSDLDRGALRTRSALIAGCLTFSAAVWMLGSGDSEVLARGPLMDLHASADFDRAAHRVGLEGCSSCHQGLGRVSAVKCFDCHQDTRADVGHTRAEILCQDCHRDHAGAQFRSASWAALDCMRCHSAPHQSLVRTRPKLVISFDRAAEATVEFHLRHHLSEEIGCPTCHAGGERTERAACGQCHAPDDAQADECQLCHGVHPERSPRRIAPEPSPQAGPRAVWAGLAVLGALLFSPFLLAGLIPAQRRASDSRSRR